MSQRAEWWVRTVAWSVAGLLLFSCSSCTYLAGGHGPGVSDHQYFHGSE